MSSARTPQPADAPTKNPLRVAKLSRGAGIPQDFTRFTPAPARRSWSGVITSASSRAGCGPNPGLHHHRHARGRFAVLRFSWQPGGGHERRAERALASGRVLIHAGHRRPRTLGAQGDRDNPAISASFVASAAPADDGTARRNRHRLRMRHRQHIADRVPQAPPREPRSPATVPGGSPLARTCSRPLAARL